ncbi:hypothetical protein BpHYR1_031578 [Brachionus plicatilis]|uniref:DUF3987 domain-containing protein n=1 Tax=Brachionus plicatilis TaxID=10195 RepID=A0A3M7QBC3_BRAPC|nr:hypothetical protein BpHYR1_031578 [Brachionus plicatilis]
MAKKNLVLENFSKNLEISRVQEKLYKIPFEPVFDGEIGSYLHGIGARHSVCKEFLICPLFTGIAHLMQHSYVFTLTTLSEKSVFYSCLVANPSTGKSTAMSLIKKSLNQIEEYKKIPRKKSNLINAGTVEALLTNLETNPCMVSFFDESSTFMSSFGLYKGGDGKYDRSVYLELYTGPDGYDRTLTRHMSDYINFVRQEKNSRDDGLIQRFHICAPRPIYFKTEDMVKIPPEKYCLTVLLYIISKLNEIPIQYILEEKATHYFYKIYDSFKIFAEKFGNNYDLFMAAMCGKSASQILRIAMFIHIFKKSYSILKQLEAIEQLNLNIQKINPRLESAIISITKQNNKFNIISEESLKKAVNLVNYFNKNKLCFAEYENIDYTLDLFQIMDRMAKKIILPENIKNYNSKFNELSKKILFFPTDESLTFKINDLNQSLSKTYKKDDICTVAIELENLGLGTLTDEKLNGILKKPNKYFTKINQHELNKNNQAISNLAKIGISPADYMSRVYKATFNDSLISLNNKKNTENQFDDIVDIPEEFLDFSTQKEGNSSNNDFQRVNKASIEAKKTNMSNENDLSTPKRKMTFDDPFSYLKNKKNTEKQFDDRVDIPEEFLDFSTQKEINSNGNFEHEISKELINEISFVDRNEIKANKHRQNILFSTPQKTNKTTNLAQNVEMDSSNKKKNMSSTKNIKDFL